MTFKDISHCARLSKKLNRIAKDAYVWKSKEKLSIIGQKVPTEFLFHVVNNGVKALSLTNCKVLPPKSPSYKNLKLKNLEIIDCQGDEQFITRVS